MTSTPAPGSVDLYWIPVRHAVDPNGTERVLLEPHLGSAPPGTDPTIPSGQNFLPQGALRLGSLAALRGPLSVDALGLVRKRIPSPTGQIGRSLAVKRSIPSHAFDELLRRLFLSRQSSRARSVSKAISQRSWLSYR